MFLQKFPELFDEGTSPFGSCRVGAMDEQMVLGFVGYMTSGAIVRVYGIVSVSYFPDW